MVSGYSGLKENIFLGIFRIVFNLVFCKGNKFGSYLSKEVGIHNYMNKSGVLIGMDYDIYHYMNDIFDTHKERITKEFGDSISDMEFYPLNYLVKLQPKDFSISFFLYKDSTNSTDMYKINTYNIEGLFGKPRNIDVLISDNMFAEKEDEKENKENTYYSKIRFCSLLMEIYEYLLPLGSLKLQALIALIAEVLFVDGYESVKHCFPNLNCENDIITGHKAEAAIICYQYNIATLIEEYSKNEYIMTFFDTQIEKSFGNSITENTSALIVEFLEKVNRIYEEYLSSLVKPI